MRTASRVPQGGIATKPITSPTLNPSLDPLDIVLSRSRVLRLFDSLLRSLGLTVNSLSTSITIPVEINDTSDTNCRKPQQKPSKLGHRGLLSLGRVFDCRNHDPPRRKRRNSPNPRRAWMCHHNAKSAAMTRTAAKQMSDHRWLHPCLRIEPPLARPGRIRKGMEVGAP